MKNLMTLWLLLGCLAGQTAETQFPFPRTRDCRIADTNRVYAAVVAPEHLRLQAEAISIAVRKLTGRALPVLSDQEPEKLLKRTENLLILGNREENRLTSELYDRYFIILDADYPGPGGWLIRFAPHPESAKQILVFAGGSERAGTERAVKQLLAMLRKIFCKNAEWTLPWCWELHHGRNFQATPVAQAYNAPLWQEVNGYYGNQGYFGWNIISRLLALFYLTGDTAYAQEFLRLAFPDAEALKYLKRPEITGESIELKTRPLSGSYHYLAHLMVIYWNLVCDHPFFTPEIRAKVEREFVRQYEYLGRKEANLEVTKVCNPMSAIPDRHMTYSALTLYTLCRYLNVYDPRPEWASGLHAADCVFDSLKKRFYLIGEKGNHYWLPTSQQALMDYLMFSGMQHRIPKQHMELLTSQVELLASGRQKDPFLAFGCMAFFNQLYHLNGMTSALTMRDSNGQDDRVFRLGRSFRPAGVSGTPLPNGQWRRGHLSQEEIAAQKPNFPNRSAVFALASLRNANGDFLLLDGRDENGRTPKHTLATMQLALNGMPLLSGYRSQLYSGCDGLISPERRTLAELLKMTTIGETAVFSARVSKNNFITHTRTWLKRTGRYALAIDAVNPEKTASSLLLNFSWELDENVRLDGLHPGFGDLTTAAIDRGVWLGKSQMNLKPKERIWKGRPMGPDRLVARKAGEALEAEFELQQPFHGYLLPHVLRAGNAALVDISLDGIKKAGPLNRIAQEVSAQAVWIGPVKLTPGKHVLKLTSAGEARKGCGQVLGISGIRLIPNNQTAAYRIGFSQSVKLRQKTAIDDTMNGGSGNLLEIRYNAPAECNHTRYFFTLFAPAGNARGGNCVTLAPNAVALYLPEPALAVVGSYGGIHAQAAILAQSHLSGSGITRIRSLVKADHPVDMDWDFQTGRLAVTCSEATTLQLAGSDRSLSFAAGTHSLVRHLPKGDRPKMEGIHKGSRQMTTADVHRINLPRTKLVPVWRHSISGFPAAQHVFLFRGRPAVLTAIGKKVLVLDMASGKELLSWREASDVTSLHAVPQANLLIVGRIDCRVLGYDLQGKHRWTFQSEMHPDVFATGKAYWFRTYPGLGGIRAIADGLFRNNRHQLFIGTASTVEILNLDGTLDKRIRQWWGPCCQFTMIRRGNGENVMLVGRRHNGFHHLGILEASNPQFNRRGFWDLANSRHFVHGWIGVIRGHIFFEDLSGKGVPEVISDLTGIDNRIAIWDVNGKPVCDVPLFGANDAPMRATDRPVSNPMPVRDTTIAALDQGKIKHIYTVTEDALLLEFDPSLQLQRCTSLPIDPLLITAFPANNRLLICGRGGEVLMTDGSGRPVGIGKIMGTPLWESHFGKDVVIGTDRELAMFTTAPAAPDKRKRQATVQ